MSFEGIWHLYMWWSLPKFSVKHLKGRKMRARDGQEQSRMHMLTWRFKKNKAFLARNAIYVYTHTMHTHTQDNAIIFF